MLTGKSQRLHSLHKFRLMCLGIPRMRYTYRQFIRYRTQQMISKRYLP